MKHRLTLAYEGVAAPPRDVIQACGATVVDLDMSYNRVTDLKFLLEMPNVESLVLDHNLITSHVKIPFRPKVTILWVNHNKIENLGLFVTTLAKSFPNLRILSMMNNIAAPSYFNGGTYQQYMDYRYFVMSNLPHLEMLDDRPIIPEERTEAQRLYPRPLVKPKGSGAGSNSSVPKKKSKSKSKSPSSPPAVAAEAIAPRAAPASPTAPLPATSTTSATSPTTLAAPTTVSASQTGLPRPPPPSPSTPVAVVD